jgi:hypothetical protein
MSFYPFGLTGTISPASFLAQAETSPLLSSFSKREEVWKMPEQWLIDSETDIVWTNHCVDGIVF